MARVAIGGNPVHTSGELPAVGAAALTDGTVKHTELVTEIAHEPNYDAAL